MRLGFTEKMIPSFSSVRNTVRNRKSKCERDNTSHEHRQLDPLQFQSADFIFSVDGEQSTEPDAEQVAADVDVQVQDFYDAPQREPLALVKPKVHQSDWQGPGPSVPSVDHYPTGPVQQPIPLVHPYYVPFHYPAQLPPHYGPYCEPFNPFNSLNPHNS